MGKAVSAAVAGRLGRSLLELVQQCHIITQDADLDMH